MYCGFTNICKQNVHRLASLGFLCPAHLITCPTVSCHKTIVTAKGHMLIQWHTLLLKRIPTANTAMLEDMEILSVKNVWYVCYNSHYKNFKKIHMHPPQTIHDADAYEDIPMYHFWRITTDGWTDEQDWFQSFLTFTLHYSRATFPFLKHQYIFSVQKLILLLTMFVNE